MAADERWDMMGERDISDDVVEDQRCLRLASCKALQGCPSLG